MSEVFTRWQDPTIEKLQQENQELKRQLEYLRSGEYLNQLKFERNMLEDIVQNGGVSKEDKEFIDMTHRNTELLEENQKLKHKIEVAIEYINNNQLYYEDYDYDYEDNLYLAGIEDSYAKRNLLTILGGDVDDE